MPTSTSCSSRGSVEALRHHRIAELNRVRLRPGLGDDDWRDRLEQETMLRIKEHTFIEEERARIAAAAATAPSDPERFVRWFEALERFGPGQHDPLFDYLAERASLAEMRWFLTQEVAGEAGFDDLVALTQVRLPDAAKLELARNYWDEMGRGKAVGMHGPMLARLAAELDIGDVDIGDVVWQSLALSNLLVGLAANHHYAYQSVGALGVIELTAPGRAAKVNAGLERLGVGGKARQYFALHATLDVQHSRAWNDEALLPLVREDPRRARAIAEGALMRLSAGAACFERYREELGLTTTTATATADDAGEPIADAPQPLAAV